MISASLPVCISDVWRCALAETTDWHACPHRQQMWYSNRQCMVIPSSGMSECVTWFFFLFSKGKTQRMCTLWHNSSLPTPLWTLKKRKCILLTVVLVAFGHCFLVWEILLVWEIQTHSLVKKDKEHFQLHIQVTFSGAALFPRWFDYYEIVGHLSLASSSLRFGNLRLRETKNRSFSIFPVVVLDMW